MARVRLRMGPSEVEIDSRDFYVDNETVRAVIEEMALCMQEAPAAGRPPAPLPTPAPQVGGVSGRHGTAQHPGGRGV